jgi:predicted glycosyltransferase
VVSTRVWIDLANSPHVPLLAPVITRLESEGHEVALTVRDHAQTLQLAEGRWPCFQVIGRESPPGRVSKGRSIARRAEALRRFAKKLTPDVAFSHNSYAQLLGARLAGVARVTMMDYEHQPVNHLAFRLADRTIVPAAFPERSLRRFGAAPEKVVRYPGFKEELYLTDFRPGTDVVEQLGLDRQKVIAVMRPPPEGALYHPMANQRFEELVRLAAARDDVEAVLLPRTTGQAARYRTDPRLRVPERAVDGCSLLAAADLVIGGGGTMNRESAVLGTPTYTVFAGKLAAVDAELIRLGRMHDLRAEDFSPRFERKRNPPPAAIGASPRAEQILDTVLEALTEVAS